MAVLVASGSALSVAANAKSAEQVAGTYQHVGAGVFTLVARASATGLNVTSTIGGVALANDLAIPYTGTAGGLDASAHVIAAQVLPGGRAELTFRNTTAGAITVDFMLFYDAM